MSLNRKQMGGMSFIVPRGGSPAPLLRPVRRWSWPSAAAIILSASAVLHLLWVAMAGHLAGWF